MSEDIPLVNGVDPVTEPAQPGELTQQVVDDMEKEYQHLVRTFTNACDGMNPAVVIAALYSVAGSVAVQTIVDESECRRYLGKCGNDVLMRVGPAYKAMAQQKEKASGSDAGKESKDGN